tara:strand:- start:7682 stop:9133 length:1452 start_codon:yes stop_codon:yes gene_type:complete
MFKFFIYIKYNFYFFSLVTYLIYLYNYYKFNNNLLEHHIINCHNLIIKSGCLTIKIAQNVNKLISFINEDKEYINFFNIIFNTLYESCNIHSFNYTEKVFKNEFNQELKDNFYIFKENKSIKSGSIAQIYKAKVIRDSIFYKEYDYCAIKVVHPEVDIQINYLLIYVKIYDFFYKRFYFLGTIFNLLDIKFLFESLSKQNNMNYEYENLSYFYNEYINNSYICIPTPIISSKNILIMEFIEAIDIESFNNNTIENQNKTTNILNLLISFFKDNTIFLDRLHADLHEFNWKIKLDNHEKIVIFDYGFVVNKKKIINNFDLYKKSIKEIHCAIDTRNYDLFSDNIFYFVKNNKNPEFFDLKKKFNDFTKTFDLSNDKNSIIIGLFIFAKNNKFHLDEIITNIGLMTLNIKKCIDSYIYPSVSNSDMLLLHVITQKNFLLEKNIFHNIIKMLDDYYLYNKDFINTIKKDNFFIEDLNKNDNISYNI